MTGSLFDRLSQTRLDQSLDGLESDVWSAVAASEIADRRLGRLATMQCAVLVATVVGSAAMGGLVTNRALAATPDLGVFSPHAAYAPSSRLVAGR